MHLSNRSQKTLKVARIFMTHSPNGLCPMFLFLPNLDVICNMLSVAEQMYNNMEIVC